MASIYPGKLSLSNDEIRLIKLLPGDWGDEIRCELVYSSLRNVQPYHALSYVWGSPHVTRSIILNGQVFSATINLESALRHLRHQLSETLLWVDALCINQADNEERTHQVNLMGKIYGSSKSVLVYLGDGINRRKSVRRSKANLRSPSITKFFNDDRDIPLVENFMKSTLNASIASTGRGAALNEMQATVDVFSLIRKLSSLDHLTDLSIFTTNYDSIEIQESVFHVFESLRQLMHPPFTPWWGRIWVVQEVILPPKVTIICGTVSAPWAMFSRASSRYLHHIQHCCSKYAEIVPRDCSKVLEDFCHRVLDIEDLRSAYAHTAGDPGHAQPKSVTQGTCVDSTADQRSLISLLRRFRSRKASDPRDKVYALLSLVQQTLNRPPILPDYSLSEPEVFQKAALESIYSSGSLCVLHVDLSRKFRQDLPTWVPDLEAPGDFTHNARMDAIGMYDVCATDPITPKTVVVCGRTLVVQSRYVDGIIYKGPTMISDGSDAIREILSVWIQLRDLSVYSMEVEYKAIYQTIWRVLCADILYYPHAANIRDAFRRTRPEDELMFVAWAILSKRSPFYEYPRILDQCLSDPAKRWQKMILFEWAISTEGPEAAGRQFEILFPSSAARRSLILTAYEWKYGVIERMQVLKEKPELFNYTILDETDMENKHIAWRQMPWSEVLRAAKYQLLDEFAFMKDIGFLRVSAVVDMSLELQVSIFDRSIAAATKARRLFLTFGGFIGLGPADLQNGDTLCLIKGGRTPFIVRRGDSPGNYKVVGDCYTQGLMDASSLDENLFKAARMEWHEMFLE